MDNPPRVNDSDYVTRGDLDLVLARLDSRFAAFDALIDSRFAAFGALIDSRFAAFDARMDGRFAQAEARMDTRFAQTEARFEVRFAQMETSIERSAVSTIRWVIVVTFGIYALMFGLILFVMARELPRP